MENMHNDVRVQRVNPFTPQISLVILLSVCHTNLMMLVGEFVFGSTDNPLINISLSFSSLVCLLLY